MTFCAAGRSGECALATWDSAKWDQDMENLSMNWNDKKTSTQDPMNFFIDYSSYEICFYHSLFCSLILNGSGKAVRSKITTSVSSTSSSVAKSIPDIQWICPDLASKAGKISIIRVRDY